MTLPYIYSLVFFIAFAIYFTLGMYTISLNSKSVLNRLYLAACLALSIWAFCFSLANSAPDYATALFWRRLSSVGWGTVYSFLLNFYLLLTEKHRILKKKWLYALLYLPALVNVIAFGLSETAKTQYKLAETSVGWVNISANTWGDVFFDLYYVLFSLIGLMLLFRWGRGTKDPIKKKQAYLFLGSYIVTVVLGTLTDMIVNTYTSYTLPQLAPVFVLLPTTAIFYAIKRYGLMGQGKSDRVEPGRILSEVNMERFIKIMSFVYVIGGLLNFTAQYFFNQHPPQLQEILVFSAYFFAIGILLTLINVLPIKTDYKEVIFILLMLVTILLIAVNFVETASITVWAAPFIVIMLSVLFNKRLMIFWIGFSILAAQIHIWARMPRAIVQVDGSDYLARIGILSITLGLAHFVNRVYVERLEENEAQIRFQKLVSQISGEFVKVSEADLDEKIYELLALSGKHFQVDRTFFISLADEQKIYEWCNEGVEPEADHIPKLTGEAFPWWMSETLKWNLVHVTDVETLPMEAQAEKEMFFAHKMRSLISIPVKNKGRTLGYLFFASVKKARTFRGNHQELLRILANLLSDALVKVEAEKEIRYMAYYDALTGSPNNTLFKNQLEQTIQSAKGTGRFIGVLFIDLDSFKIVNDTLGHLGGDEMLKQVTRRLSGCLRPQDMVSRFGGDEFLINIAGVDRVEDIREIADTIKKAIAQPVMIKDHEFFITASAGIAVYPADGETTEELIKHADLAMYASKEKGKNQFTFCSSGMKEKVLQKSQLTKSLYRALERKEFILYYQPQVNVQTREIVGLEALVRWNNPDLGMVSPAAFIPLAEQTGLILPIGEWVLETACRQNKLWQEMGLPPVRMAVNLSVMQFQDRNLLGMVDRALQETGLESKYLELEVTESAAAADGEDSIIQVLHQLKELGVSLSIDDFGSGYSSLSRLKTLPVDRIKIDMQFVRGISKGNEDEAIAKTIIQLAKNLKLNVIAEGVETEPQVEFFNQYECDEIQGYFFYKPMPASEIERVLLGRLAV
ncbi:EAL domain-containing protein [Paenibacillus sp. NFR01]|uniref:EAL domain-containing protein n=1 Tax=Paenibacillus sp. NFR01 TaxID=1566279 RepID=UPI0008D1CE67|nr:EAL domain-containing protein [Paenibacillus sp. NFR01]SEU27806.1 diguanylate cyclase (GGDEF) domain-containing protein [Paenibacillus sp. NFR01]